MTKPRTALFLLPSDRMGGAERVTLTLMLEAARSGAFERIECFVLCWRRTGTLDVLETDHGATLIYANAPNHLLGLLAMLRFLSGRSYDFVFSSHLHINAGASMMRKLGRLKARRLVARESHRMFERNFGVLGWAVRSLYRLYGGQDMIICQSERMKRSLVENIPPKIGRLVRVLPNPIDIEWIVSSINRPAPDEFASVPSDHIRIVWCGRLVPMKAPLRAVDALGRLHKAGYVHTHLVMIGDGPLRAALETHIAETGLADHVTLLGHQPFPPAIMSRCNLGLLSSDIEGFPNVILEMMASGVNAVVSTECVDGLDEIDGVHVARSFTADALAARLLPLLEHPTANHDVSALLDARNPARFLERMREDVGAG